MKINPSVGFESYKNAVQSYKNAEPAASRFQEELRIAAAEPTNTDKVTISGDAANRAEIGRVIGSISAQVESSADSDRIAALRTAVANGTYNVSAAQVAAAMLGSIK